MGSSKLWFSVVRSSVARSNSYKPRKHIYYPLRSHSSSPEAHPWPECVQFADRLKSKGYFPADPDDPESVRGDSDPAWDVHSKLLNTAGLAFARHRFDLFESLSLLDIQNLVEKRCPSLYRKVIYSAKRLRAHLQLDEAKVCIGCNLRGRCEKYCEVLYDDKAAARTIDVVRVLLAYALDPYALADVTISSDRAIIKKSARSLFSQLIELSYDLPAPEIPAPLLKEKPQKYNDNDWKCDRCSYMNFARNIECKQCQRDSPKRIDYSGKMNFGDWICPGCGSLQYATKTSCHRCRVPRPPIQLKPAEWECPTCAYVNWRQDRNCKKCNVNRPRAFKPLP